MEIKDNKLVLDIPKGMEVDVEKSDLKAGIIAFKKSPLSYEDVVCSLRDHCFRPVVLNVTNCNVEKIAALDRLMDIAKYYNGDWKPNWSDAGESKYVIIAGKLGNLFVETKFETNYGVVCFRSKEDAQAVIGNPNFRSILDAIYKD